jgi:hypothetical protein
MLVRLDAPVAVAAPELAFTLDEDAFDAPASLRLRRGGMDVELRLSGGTHQVIAGGVVETVGVLPGRPGPLPYRLRRDVGGWTHTFTADVYRRGAADFDRAVTFLRGYLSERDDALVGESGGTLSGLLLRPVRRGLDWRGWHTFVTGREIVVTRSRLLIH